MAQGQDLHSIGKEYSELKFDSFWDWLIQIDSLAHHWKHEPSYVISQFAFLFGGIATFLHALTRGGRLPYLWLGVIIHGFVIEFVSYVSPDIDNFWHSQTPVMLLGRRLPLHILFLYPCFIYNASIAVAKARLPRWAEPFAVGLGCVLIDIPYDIMSVNFLHWTWHDTDPNIYDRHYWVPWNSYYFHACFAAGFTFWFHFTRKLICKTDKWEADTLPKELLCTLIASFLGAPSGVFLFLPNYHPLHDIFKIHSEVTFFITFTIFLLIIWTADRKPKSDKHDMGEHKTHCTTWLLISHLIIHYSSFLMMALFMKPENEISTGLKEPVGPCDEYSPVQTAFGMVLKKRKYLCVSDYDEKYFDFHCLPNGKPPSNGASWYTTCGVPLPNRVEYCAIIATICLLGFVVFRNLHFGSYGDAVFEGTTTVTSTKSKKIKQKYY